MSRRVREGLFLLIAITVFSFSSAVDSAQAADEARPNADAGLGQAAEARAAGSRQEGAPTIGREKVVEAAKRIIVSIKKARAQAIRLSLSESIVIGLQNNLDLLIERISPMSAAEDVVIERAEFDPSLVSGTDQGDSLFSYSEEREQNVIRGSGDIEALFGTGTWTRSDSYDAGLGVQQPLHTGGTISLGYGFNRSYGSSFDESSTINPSWESALFLSIEHPLLRGAGLDVNLANIRIAINERMISEEGFRAQALDVAFNVESAYWNLIRAIQDMEVSVKSLQVALDNRRSSELQVQAGTRPKLDLTTADAGVAGRLGELIASEATVRDREDQLKNVVNLPENWFLTDLQIVPVDAPDEESVETEEKPQLTEYVRTALRCRPEIQQAELDIRNTNIALRVRKNGLLPKLDLSAGIAYTGTDAHYEGSNDELGEGKYYRRSVGLTFQYPLGNRSARAAYRQATLDRRSARLYAQKVRQDIVVTVRAALRSIRTNRQRVITTREARDLNQERLDAEQRKKEVGLATSLDVLEVEEDLAAAERDYINALLDYQISLAKLDREAGTLLDIHGVQIRALLTSEMSKGPALRQIVPPDAPE